MKISFREVEIHDARMTLDWRTSERVTRYMITDVEYSMEKQEKWIMESYAKENFYHWVISYGSKPVGMIGISDFCRELNRTLWGYYLGDEKYAGIGGLIPPFLYNWLFLKVGLKNIFTEVFYNNAKAIDLYLGYGHKFMPVRDRVIHKNGREILLIGLSLDSRDWDTEKYKDSMADFPTNKWLCGPEMENG
jgi:RimJ/RimL family protein N-acetyltransferase